jgi:hypothetical protein
MQTSFMHPPFGFSLFYLRSVAPKDDYIDKVTKKKIPGVATGDIYWGSVPFICIQIVMIAVVLLFPGMVTHYKGTGAKVDPSTVTIEMQDEYGADLNPFDDSGDGGGMPVFK